MSDQNPKVSVVIPCYNMGQYLDEAVKSVLAQTYQDFEIIIVDDGSTDETTKQILSSYNQPKTRVIRTANQGPSAARNTGIQQARGEYILPLDADDKVASRYMEKAVEILDASENVGIVTCEAELFGDEAGKWTMPAYSFPRILLENLIVEPSFFRIEDYRKTKGYNPNMIYSHEDHDLWLSIIELGRSVYRIPEVGYYYRRRAGSRDALMNAERRVHCFTNLFHNHQALYESNIDHVFRCIEDLRDELKKTRLELLHIKSRRLFKLLDRWWRLRERLGI
ncbi:MAG: glycosyltransferase family 2 protein [Verrucomicrobia bacterium]|nr:glycosyltransferase family 2 protein [Verrucomicrobiota bacterium]